MPNAGQPEGAVLTIERVDGDGRYALPIGPAGQAGPETQALRGRIIRRGYRVEAAILGLPGVIDGYHARLSAMGFAERFRCAAQACGGLGFRFGIELLPPPAMLMDAAAFEQLTMSREGAEPDHVSVLVSRVLGDLHIQTVTVVPSDADPAPVVLASPPGDAATESPPEPTSLPSGGWNDLGARLLAEGHAVLAGVAFETGGARLTEGSGAAIDALARLLAERAELVVLIVGHSDNQGPLDLNRRLSLERAAAVRAALIDRGIAAERMEADGVGFLAPIASNATEAGRALNRRVEIVLR
ncbi:MAG: OmpA family protein [Pseudomonadota bacterium]